MTGSDDLLQITSSSDGLVVSGEIDAHTAPALAAAIADTNGATIVVDLAGVEFVDSSGLRVLIDAHQQALDDDRALRLVNPSDAVRRLFDISGVDGYLNVDTSAD